MILSAGKDADILLRRNLILQERGYGVVPAHSRNETVVLSGDRRFDLILLCWSFGKEAEPLAADLSIVCPGIPVLALRSSGRVIRPQDLQEVERMLGLHRSRAQIA
jgi:DNA-binding response OmpR family regulator